jgi:hypothetical protein
VGVCRDDGEQGEHAREQQRPEQDEWDGDQGAAGGTASDGAPSRSQAPVALAPREAGLHVGPHDSMGK